MTGETASFVIRFTQKIYQNDKGESDVQWRGNIRHVQGGDEKNFSQFNDVVTFLQEKLADLTIIAMEDKIQITLKMYAIVTSDELPISLPRFFKKTRVKIVRRAKYI